MCVLTFTAGLNIAINRASPGLSGRTSHERQYLSTLRTMANNVTQWDLGKTGLLRNIGQFLGLLPPFQTIPLWPPTESYCFQVIQVPGSGKEPRKPSTP